MHMRYYFFTVSCLILLSTLFITVCKTDLGEIWKLWCLRVDLQTWKTLSSTQASVWAVRIMAGLQWCPSMSYFVATWYEVPPPWLRGWEFCPFCPFFATFSTFTKIPQVPSFQTHSPVKTVFRQNPKNARKSQNTPSTNPYQNETQFSSSSLKNATSGHARPPKSVIWPPVISGTNSRQNSIKFP